MEMSGQLYPRERALSTHWIGGWMCPRVDLDALTKRKGPCPFQESNPGRPARILVTVLTELSWLLNLLNNYFKPLKRFPPKY
jgi:hypothetical protein